MSTATDLDDGLTDEERAALAEEEGASEAQPNADDGEGAANAADEPAANAEPAAAADGAAAEPAAAAEPTPPAADEVQQQSTPVLVAALPADIEVKLAEISSKKEALLDSFDNGDVTAKEYQQQLDTLAKEERAIERQQDRADLAKQMEDQRLKNEWESTCNRFVEGNSVYKEMPWLYMQLDAKVRELASKPETANWAGQKFLDEAHKQLVEQYKLPTDNKQVAKPIKPPRELPPNLAKVPAAEVEDTNGGQYAVLDRMANSDPMGYEDALSKMSVAQRESYLAA